jgi:hypothetical protein
VLAILPDFNQVWSLSAEFYKIPNITFYGNPSSDIRADTSGNTDGQTDGHDEGNVRF